MQCHGFLCNVTDFCAMSRNCISFYTGPLSYSSKKRKQHYVKGNVFFIVRKIKFWAKLFTSNKILKKIKVYITESMLTWFWISPTLTILGGLRLSAVASKMWPATSKPFFEAEASTLAGSSSFLRNFLLLFQGNLNKKLSIPAIFSFGKHVLLLEINKILYL